MASQKTLAIILGAGPGTGASLGSAFAKFHDVALLARSTGSLQAVADAITGQGGVAVPFTCDTTSAESVKSAFSEIKRKFPDHLVKVACFNASPPFVVKPFLQLSVEKDVTPGINISINGAFYFSQAVIPLMLEHQTGGTLLFSGATAALKSGARFAGFAPSKFALRGLSQSLAREFGPQGIHVVHTILDGLIDTPKVAQMMGAAKEGERLSPDAIAQAYVYLSQQDKSCWSQEIDLRPFAEKF